MSFLKRIKKLKDVKPAPEEERVKLEKSDIPAMIIAALITLIIPSALILGLLVFLAMAIFGLL